MARRNPDVRVPGIPGGTVRVLFVGAVPLTTQKRVLRALGISRDPVVLTRSGGEPLPANADVTVLDEGLAEDRLADLPGTVLCLGSGSCPGGTSIGEARRLAPRLVF